MVHWAIIYDIELMKFDKKTIKCVFIPEKPVT